jgi:hypothetical protein
VEEIRNTVFSITPIPPLPEKVLESAKVEYKIV